MFKIVTQALLELSVLAIPAPCSTPVGVFSHCGAPAINSSMHNTMSINSSNALQGGTEGRLASPP